MDIRSVPPVLLLSLIVTFATCTPVDDAPKAVLEISTIKPIIIPHEALERIIHQHGELIRHMNEQIQEMNKQFHDMVFKEIYERMKELQATIHKLQQEVLEGIRKQAEASGMGHIHRIDWSSLEPDIKMWDM